MESLFLIYGSYSLKSSCVKEEKVNKEVQYSFSSLFFNVYIILLDQSLRRTEYEGDLYGILSIYIMQELPYNYNLLQSTRIKINGQRE